MSNTGKVSPACARDFPVDGEFPGFHESLPAHILAGPEPEPEQATTFRVNPVVGNQNPPKLDPCPSNSKKQ